MLKFKIIFLSILFLTLFGWVEKSGAAPSVSSVSGTIAEGQEITINGTGLGANGPSVAIFDDFEKGQNNQQISTSINSAEVGEWDRTQDTVVYSTEQHLSGSQALKTDWSSDSGTEGGRLAGLDIDNATEVFYSFWTMVPISSNIPGDGGPGAGGPNWKLSWLFGSGAWPDMDYVNTVVLQADLGTVYSQHMVYDDYTQYGGQTRKPTTNEESELGDSMAKGRWTRHDVYLRGGQTDGIVRNWELGMSGMTSRVNLANVYSLLNGHSWTRFNIPGYGRETSNSLTYYDDIYFATGNGAQARVEIGNAATYSASTNLAILTPTAWSDSAVTAIVRQGSFGAGAAYLYMIDSTGVMNANGYPIIVGNLSDTTPPSAPANLAVQ